MPYLHAWQGSYGRIKTPVQSVMVWLLLQRKEVCKYEFNTKRILYSRALTSHKSERLVTPS